MPNVNVSLDVRNWPSNGSDGYTSTTATNDQVYSYQYTGGTDGHGNVDSTVGAGSVAISISLHSDPRYIIQTIVISDDVENQLTWQPGGTPTTASVTDSDSQSGSGYYQVMISDTMAVCNFPCDPRVTNTLPPPPTR